MFMIVVFNFFFPEYMEKHIRLLETFCRVCGEKIKEKERKEDVAKYANQIEQIWKVSVLVDSPNVHPRFICIKCRVKCSNKEYLAAKFKSSQEAKLWFPHSGDCDICFKHQEARGRPSKRKRVKVANKKDKPGSGTDSASEHEDEQTTPPRVYCVSMETIRECISKVPYTDQCVIFQELCSVIPKVPLLELLMNSLKGVYILQEDDLSDSIARVPEDMQASIVEQIMEEQKPKLQVDCHSFAQTYKELETLQNFNAEEWFSRRNPIVKSIIQGLASNEKNYFQRCLTLEHLYHLHGLTFVGPCSFMTNISLLAISNSKLVVNMFGKAFPGGSYCTLKLWTRDLTSDPKEFPPGDCMVAIDNDQIVQRRWKVKVGQKSRVSVVTSVCQAEINSQGSLQTRSDLAPRYNVIYKYS